MRFLVISEHLPGPTFEHGVFQRLRIIAEALASMGDIDFLFFVGPRKQANPEEVSQWLSNRWSIKAPRVFIERYGEDPGFSSFLADYLRPVTSVHHQRGYARLNGEEQIAALGRTLADRPDCIFAHRLGPMALLLKSGLPLPPILFDLDDVEHKAFTRAIAQPPHWKLKPLMYAQVPALWLGERAAIKKAGVTLVCSWKDAEHLRRTMRVGNIAVLPNSSPPAAPVQTPSMAPPNVLFIGAYSYPPNAIAADVLIRDIWPAIRARVPGARLLIAGSKPDSIPSYASPPPGVQFTGYVEDLAGLYDRSRVVCTPIQSGSGTRIKIIEAAMYGRPIVSTTIGAEGLEMRRDKDILIEDDAFRIAERCVGLLEDPAQCDALGNAARQRAQALYGRGQAIQVIVGLVRSLLQARQAQD